MPCFFRCLNIDQYVSARMDSKENLAKNANRLSVIGTRIVDLHKCVFKAPVRTHAFSPVPAVPMLSVVLDLIAKLSVAVRQVIGEIQPLAVPSVRLNPFSCAKLILYEI